MKSILPASLQGGLRLSALAGLLILLACLSACSANRQPVVHAVAFSSPVCTFCKEILEHQLPPLIRPYEDRLQIVYVDVDTEAGYRLYLAALEAFGVPRGVPIIFIGEEAVAGINIPAQFPGLVEHYLAQGGADWPAIPGLEAYLAAPPTAGEAAAPPAGATPAAIQPSASPPNEGEAVVRFVLFWQNGCPHCHEVLDNVLPPLQAQYGDQLEILLVEIYGIEDVNRLYEVADFYGIPRQRVGVPFLVIGDQVLIGSRQIPEELPGLIEFHLARGGLDWPVIPRLDEFSRQTVFLPTPSTVPGGEVRAILFTTQDCQACQAISAAALGPLYEAYGEQLQIQTIDIVTPDDVQYLYRVASAYGLSAEEVDLPLMLIGDRLLTSEQIGTELPAAVEFYLAQGGVDYPSLPPRLQPSEASAAPETSSRPAGFVLAVIVLTLLAAGLAYGLAAPLLGRAFRLPAWSDWLIPVLLVLGIGVAAYLSYVETQAVEAVCGPVGDCNAVQQSRYARLFGVLPVGVFGLLGNFGLLAAWLGRRFWRRFEKAAAAAFWGMALFGVAFSLYLTWLEIFVIRAICLWCLSSAVIMLFLLLLGTPSVLDAFPPPHRSQRATQSRRQRA
ncbi:MAG: vitamin K epoxide reductase family protein [Anaerolineales bacterium]